MNSISQGNLGDASKIIDTYIDNLHEEYIRNHDDRAKNVLLEQIQLLQKLRTKIDSNCQFENPVSENVFSIIRNLQEYEKVLAKEIENIELTECSSVLAAYGHNAILHALEEHRKSIHNILDGKRYCDP